MIRRYAEADKTVGHREGLVHVDYGVWERLHNAVGGVEAGGTGADDGHAEGRVVVVVGRCVRGGD